MAVRGVLALLVIALGLSSTVDATPSTVGVFTQYIDHYDLYHDKDKTFQQRFLENKGQWKGNGSPIFLFLGGMESVDEAWNRAGFVHELAVEEGAYTVFLEHRYFGESLPFGKESYTNKSLASLSVSQAVSDAAIFAKAFKEHVRAGDSKVIVFGGGYSGLLASYLRYQHPNIVQGALASSAPVLMQDMNSGSRDFFFKAVTDIYRAHDKSCADRIKFSFTELQGFFEKSQEKEIQKRMRLCSVIKTDWEARVLEMWARHAVTQLAVQDLPYSVGGLPANSVDKACYWMEHFEGPLYSFSYLIGEYYNTSGTLKCFDQMKEYTPCLNPNGCGQGNQAVARDYLICSGLNPVDGPNNRTDFFPAMENFDEKEYCTEVFQVVPRRDWLADNFFGVDLSAVSNTIFSNGDRDPYREGGVITPGPKSARYSVVKVEGGAHQQDLRAANKKDAAGVVKARQEMRTIIKSWLA